LLAVVGAKLTYRLPYKWSRMSVTAAGSAIHYQSSRPDAKAEIVVEVGPRYSAPSDFDHFLTARFRLYTMLGRRPGYAQVEHPPWELSDARITHIQQSIVAAAGLTQPHGHPALHYSPGVDVRIGAPTLL